MYIKCTKCRGEGTQPMPTWMSDTLKALYNADTDEEGWVWSSSVYLYMTAQGSRITKTALSMRLGIIFQEGLAIREKGNAISGGKEYRYKLTAEALYLL